MTEYYVTAVRYDKDNSRIVALQVRRRIFEGSKVGPRVGSSREFIADLILSKTATFKTGLYNQREKMWEPGSLVHVVGEIFLSTDCNDKTKDNLGELRYFDIYSECLERVLISMPGCSGFDFFALRVYGV